MSSYPTTHHRRQQQQHLLVFLVLLACWVGASVAAPVVEEQRHGGGGDEDKAKKEVEDARQEMDEDDYPTQSRPFLPAMYLQQQQQLQHQSSPFHHRTAALVGLPGGFVDGEPVAAVDENGAVVVFQPRGSPSAASSTSSQAAVHRQRNYPAAWDKRAQTFVRFGKRAQTFVRFGKRAQTFVRFG